MAGWAEGHLRREGFGRPPLAAGAYCPNAGRGVLEAEKDAGLPQSDSRRQTEEPGAERKESRNSPEETEGFSKPFLARLDRRRAEGRAEKAGEGSRKNATELGLPLISYSLQTPP